ncbi:MAG: YihY/virulence factor BrkB family protein [Streptococcaceae bacterium]|jgi:membrane protein|nr:YihY/virulence factor BrkB family protein [Streptococcaceae bacterium]
MKKIKGLIQQVNENKIITSIKTHFSDSEMDLNSIAVAFYLLLSLFPLLLAIGNILPFLQIDHQLVLHTIQEVIPENIYTTFQSTFEQLLFEQNTSLLSVAVLTTLFAASQGISSLQTAMNKAYSLEKHRNFLLNRLLGMIVIVLLFIVTFVGVVVIGFGQDIMLFLQRHLPIPDSAVTLFMTTKWPIALVGIFCVLLILYLVIPNVVIPKIRYVLPGTLVATGGTLLLSQVFGIYARFFARRVAGYQVIGSFIILMFWLVFNAKILILGAIINSVYQEIATGKKAKPRKIVQKHIHRFRNKLNKEEEDFK